MIALKGIKKTIRENVFEQEKRKHEVQFNPVFALIVLQTTGCLCFSHPPDYEMTPGFLTMHYGTLVKLNLAS